MARPEAKPKTELAKRFREVRLALGFKERKQFAEYLGISISSLGNYETGIREPLVSAIQPYKLVCNVSLDWLITGRGEMFDSTADINRSSSESEVDIKRLQAAIEAVERGLDDYYLAPDKKAELIQIAYGMLKEDENAESLGKVIRLFSAA